MELQRADARALMDRHRDTAAHPMGPPATVDGIDCQVDVSWMVDLENQMKEGSWKLGESNFYMFNT